MVKAYGVEHFGQVIKTWKEDCEAEGKDPSQICFWSDIPDKYGGPRPCPNPNCFVCKK